MYIKKKRPPEAFEGKIFIYGWFAGKDCYIGLTDNIQRRKTQHKSHKYYLNMVHEHGKKNVKFKVITSTRDEQEALDLEQEIINIFESRGWAIKNSSRIRSLGHRKKGNG